MLPMGSVGMAMRAMLRAGAVRCQMAAAREGTQSPATAITMPVERRQADEHAQSPAHDQAEASAPPPAPSSAPRITPPVAVRGIGCGDRRTIVRA